MPRLPETNLEVGGYVLQSLRLQRGENFLQFTPGQARRVAAFDIYNQSRVVESSLAYQQNLVSVWGQRNNFIATATIQDIVKQISSGVSRGVGVALQEFAGNAQRIVNRRKGLSQLHSQVALGARTAVVQSYQQSVRPHVKYRVGSPSRLSGKIERALQRPDLITASRDGIGFINTTVLDAVAAHWRRLNYGALPAPQLPARQFPLRTSSGSIGQISDPSGPSRPFSLPNGAWLRFPGQGWNPANIVPPGRPSPVEGFFPLRFRAPITANERDVFAARRRRGQEALTGMGGITGRRQTRGIQGYRFFDAGLEYIAEQLPIRYESLAVQWFQEAFQAIGTGASET